MTSTRSAASLGGRGHGPQHDANTVPPDGRPTHLRYTVLTAIWVGAMVVGWWPIVVVLDGPPSIQLAPLVAHVCGMLAGYAVLVLIALMSRAPVLERDIGADILARWHSRGGRLVVVLILVHAYAAVVAWAQSRHVGMLLAFWQVTMLPWLMAATIGVGLRLRTAVEDAGVPSCGVGRLDSSIALQSARRWAHICASCKGTNPVKNPDDIVEPSARRHEHEGHDEQGLARRRFRQLAGTTVLGSVAASVLHACSTPSSATSAATTGSNATAGDDAPADTSGTTVPDIQTAASSSHFLGSPDRQELSAPRLALRVRPLREYGARWESGAAWMAAVMTGEVVLVGMVLVVRG